MVKKIGGELARDLAFELFDQGKRPSDEEVKALGFKPRTRYNYFQEWKKRGEPTPGAQKGSEGSPKEPKKVVVVTTDILSGATELRFVPRVYTTDYSPIIRAAQDAAVEFWGWPKGMTLGDFLDTALHFLFMEHGITLAGYTISDEAREILEAERKVQEAQETKEPEEVAK